MGKGVIIKSVLGIVVFLSAVSTWAAPALRGSFTVRQPDGTQLSVEQFGDENFHWTATTDGVMVINRNGAYYVAAIDESGELSATSVLAHAEELRDSKEQERIALQSSRLSLFHQRCRISTRSMNISDDGKYFPHQGSPRVLTILAAFQDSTFTVNQPVVAFDQYLNGETQQDLGNKNHQNMASVRQYFNICSHGQFTPQFDVVGPVTLPKEMAYYGGKGATGAGDRIYSFCSDAIEKVEEEGLVDDWTVYDNDGDGNVEMVCLIYAGYGQNQGGGEETIWARASYQGIKIAGGPKISFFNCSPEHYYPSNSIDGEGIALKDYINGTGVFIHEMSHCMGLPDLYQTNRDYVNNQGMESWDIMDYGLYTRNGFAPAPYTAWEQEVMGWKEMETVTASQHISGLLPLLEGGTAYKIANTAKENEYIVIESVMKRGLNQYANGSGLLVYHVDYPSSEVNMTDAPNNELGRPRLAVVPASGLFLNRNLCGSGKEYTSAQWKTSMGASVFPGINQVTSLTSDMNLPNFYFYEGSQATKPVGASLHHITEDDEGVSFDLTIGGEDAIHPLLPSESCEQDDYYDLLGRKHSSNTLQSGRLYIHKKTRKLFILQ